MKAKELLKRLRQEGCVEVRQKGSHIRVKCGQCLTVVPYHPGEELGIGLLKAILKDLEPCLGKDWMKP